MRRRRLLSTAGVAGLASLAGCSTSLGDVFGDTRRRTDGRGAAKGGTGPDPMTGDGTATGGAGGADGSTSPDATGDASLPDRAADPAGNVAPPRRATVVNDRLRPVFATVVVAATDDAGPATATDAVDDVRRDVLAVTGEFPRGRTRLGPERGVVARRGAYAVVVETAGGERTTATWHVAAATGDLTVRIADPADPGGVAPLAVRYPARCDPSCPPVPAEGRVSFPAGEGWPAVSPDRPRSRVRVASAARERVPVDVRLAVDGGRAGLVDYRYRPAPGTVLRFPPLPGDGELAVRVAGPGGAWAGTFSRPVDLPLAVTHAGVRFDCPGTRLDYLVHMDVGAERTVAVRLRRDGRVVAERGLTVPGGGRRGIDGVVATPGRYVAEIEVWTTAPGDGARDELVGHGRGRLFLCGRRTLRVGVATDDSVTVETLSS
jgi:hypothetical protein